MEERQKILIVEDDARLAGLIRDYLVREGYAVFLEERGDRAKTGFPCAGTSGPPLKAPSSSSPPGRMTWTRWPAWSSGPTIT